MTARQAAVVGTGLIGASTGLALRSTGWRVVGWDPDESALATALEGGALDAALPSLPAAIEGAQLIVLAGPPRAVISTLGDLDTGALVIDVAGVKEPVCRAAAHLDHFVGTHPMAGREQSGPGAASGSLFRGASWVIVEDGADSADLERVAGIVMSMGANPVRMSAAEHDLAVAIVSHLPQVLAATLLGEAERHDEALPLASGSFRDLTRVALSDPELWNELLGENRAAVVSELRSFAERLGVIADDVESNTGVTEFLSRARALRRTLAPPVMAVRVILEDQPGELAAVGRALAVSSVDVRDLQLRHGPQGGGGVLTLSVRPGEAEALRGALANEGFTLGD
ncbi:MAG TPA: prephenate dehydrogenase/arogenate dehydrogenase family protein [Acidimicrobiia bacterium]|nr:prephenate dehydrogenase/arogenate dehydrogenase family protein [Acidimicrobiia bacterium]